MKNLSVATLRRTIFNLRETLRQVRVENRQLRRADTQLRETLRALYAEEQPPTEAEVAQAWARHWEDHPPLHGNLTL